MHIRDIARTNLENGIFRIHGYPVTLTFDLLTPQLNSSSLTQDSLLTKSGKNPSMHTTDITETTSRTEGWMHR